MTTVNHVADREIFALFFTLPDTSLLVACVIMHLKKMLTLLNNAFKAHALSAVIK